ncbi:MAG TPA: hypothetical protein VLK29_06180 [Luteimonas sp.]|nr:hypothetical protein [Luteimonas sp.]
MLALSASVVVALGIYLARPWGGNHAYQDATGYLVLGGLLLFSVSPYAGLAALSRRFARAPVGHAVFVVGAGCIGMVGTLVYCDVAFVHPDAQGGLAFLSVPLVQWVATLLLLVIRAVIVRLAQPAAGDRG